MKLFLFGSILAIALWMAFETFICKHGHRHELPEALEGIYQP